MADGGMAGAAPTALYRHFDADGKLLYIGISLNALVRLSQHRSCSHWYTRIATVTLEWLPSREAAMAAEREAIRTEHPECNVAHVLRQSEDAEDDLSPAEMSRLTLARDFARFKAVYTISEAADALSLSVNNIRLALFHRELAYMDLGNKIGISGWALIDFLESVESGQTAIRRAVRYDDGTYERVPNMEHIRAGAGYDMDGH